MAIMESEENLGRLELMWVGYADRRVCIIMFSHDLAQINYAVWVVKESFI